MSISNKLAGLLMEFDIAALDWGWQQDQGSGAAVNKSETRYIYTRVRLERAIARLERKAQIAKELGG